MARYAVLASGSGGNFEAIVTTLQASGHHPSVLIADRKDAFCLERATRLGVPSSLVLYEKGNDGKIDRAAAERSMTGILEEKGVDLVVLAGFMRVLTEVFVRRWKGRLINIHPALLPRHAGAHGISDSFASADENLGVTVHWVDEGVDTGPVVEQSSFRREPGLTLEQTERRIHELEHELYPRIVRRLLDQAERLPYRFGSAPKI